MPLGDDGVVELREWILTEHASAFDRMARSILDIVPRDRWRDGVGDGGSSIAYLLYHITYHADLAINAVLPGGDPAMATWRGRLGLGGHPAHAGLGETEDVALTADVDVEALVTYAESVQATGTELLGALDLARLGDVPAAGEALERAGVAEAAVPWLHAMWAGKPASFFVQWEAIGHRINHVGEMVSVRNRLGLSPF